MGSRRPGLSYVEEAGVDVRSQRSAVSYQLAPCVFARYVLRLTYHESRRALTPSYSSIGILIPWRLAASMAFS